MSNQSKILDNSAASFEVKGFLSENLSSGKYTQFSVATGYSDLLLPKKLFIKSMIL